MSNPDIISGGKDQYGFVARLDPTELLFSEGPLPSPDTLEIQDALALRGYLSGLDRDSLPDHIKNYLTDLNIHIIKVIPPPSDDCISY